MSAGFPLRISHETGEIVKYVINDQGQFVTASRRQKNDTKRPDSLPEYFTVAQVAAALNLSPDTVRRRFAHRADVAAVSARSRVRGKRSYTSLRIPKAAIDAYLAGR